MSRRREVVQRPAEAALEPLPRRAWDFLTNCVWTSDEFAVEKDIDPVQQFPDYAYLRYLSEQLELTSRLRVEKSRDMMVTWWAAGTLLHAALIHPGIYCAYQSKKLLDANLFLESRFLHIWRNIPAKFFRPRAAHSRSEGVVTIEHRDGPNSYIVGVPEGTEQSRQYKYVRYLWDEAGTSCDGNRERQAKTWTAIRPTLAGHGKIMILSSAKGQNLFRDLGYEAVSG